MNRCTDRLDWWCRSACRLWRCSAISCHHNTIWCVCWRTVWVSTQHWSIVMATIKHSALYWHRITNRSSCWPTNSFLKHVPIDKGVTHQSITCCFVLSHAFFFVSLCECIPGYCCCVWQRSRNLLLVICHWCHELCCFSWKLSNPVTMKMCWSKLVSSCGVFDVCLFFFLKKLYFCIFFSLAKDECVRILRSPVIAAHILSPVSFEQEQEAQLDCISMMRWINECTTNLYIKKKKMSILYI